MFRKILQKAKEVLQKMGLVKNIKNLSDMKDIPVDDAFYNLIDDWFAIYRGYFSKWHDTFVHTIGGGRKETMESLNMAKVVSSEMAALVFNERCEISVANDNFQEFVDEVLDNNKFYTNFQTYLEYNFAAGGMVIKPYFEDDQIKLAYLAADSFVPISWNNEGIREMVFPYETIKGKHKYTHLEWHLWEGDNYIIRNQLFKADRESKEVGKEVPLTELFEGIEPEVIISGLKLPLFIHFKPNTANHIDHKSPLGVSIFSGALSTLRSIDTAYDSFHREFRLGKRRIIVPASAVQTVVGADGVMHRYFDANDEVYQAFDTGDMDSSKIHDNTVEIRAEEHIAAINAYLNVLAMQTGFSAGTFSFDGQGVKTATEVVSENSKTFRTKQSHEVIVEEGLSTLVDVIAQLASLYNIYDAGDYEVSVSFDDSIAEDKTATVAREIQLVSAGLQSKVDAIRNIFKIGEKEAEKKLQKIREESQTAQAEAMDFFGLNAGGGQEDSGNGANNPPDREQSPPQNGNQVLGGAQ